MPRPVFIATLLFAAFYTGAANAGPDRSDTLSPQGETILGHAIADGPTDAMSCDEELDGWFFDLDDRYVYLTFQTCKAPKDSTDLATTPTSVLLYFHEGRLIGGDADISASDTRKMRIQLRKKFGIPAMDNGQFLEDELYAFKDMRYSFSYGGEDDGLFVTEYVDRLRTITADKARSEWDEELDKALTACTAALVDDAPGQLSWPDRPHPWTYPTINWPGEDGEPITLYLTSFGAQYEDQFGFEQELPDFGCTYNIEDGSVSLTTG